MGRGVLQGCMWRWDDVEDWVGVIQSGTRQCRGLGRDYTEWHTTV